MYKLKLNNEEFFLLKGLLETEKAHRAFRPNYRPQPENNDALSALLTKLVISQCDLEEEAWQEAQAERYAQNLHSAPEGA